MNGSEASAVFSLLRWLGHDPIRPNGSPRRADDAVFLAVRPTDEQAAEAVAFLANRAGQALGITAGRAAAQAAFERLCGRLQAADSDGAAQAVCRALATHNSHGGTIPWPLVRRPFEEWSELVVDR